MVAPAVHIADADPELRELDRKFFAHHGWRVQICEGGLDCLSQLRQNTPHLLILDLELRWGGADGLLAVMRNGPRLSRVPVIVTSTEASPEALSDTVSPPVVQALGEPFSLPALLEIVCSGWRKGQPVSSKESGNCPALAHVSDRKETLSHGPIYCPGGAAPRAAR